MIRKRIALRSTEDYGAVAVMVALTLTVLLLGFSLAVDVGQQRVKSKDMQALSDIAALDLSRRLDGKSTTAQLRTKMNEAVARTVARNKVKKEDRVTATYVMGNIASDGTFSATAEDRIPLAVKVTATQNFTWSVKPKSVDSVRTAIASATIITGSDCLKVGSYAGVLGGSGAKALNPFFRQLFGQSTLYGSTYTASNFNWEAVAAESINMSEVARRMGYASITELQKATVNLKTLYSAMNDAANSEPYGTLNLTRQVASTHYSQANNAAPFPMKAILGPGVSGSSVRANTLDMYGGIAAYYNGTGRSVNPQFSGVFPSFNSSGTTEIAYDQGPRQHCMKPGDKVTTGADATFQSSDILNGSLNPKTYSSRITSAGLVDVAFSPTLSNNIRLFAKIEPVELTLKSTTCTDTTKTANFDISKGNIELSLDQSTYAGYVSEFPATLTGYGAVKIDWGFPLNFKAKLNFAPSTNNTVTATQSTLGQPLFLSNGTDRFQLDIADTVAAFPTPRIIAATGQYREVQLTAADMTKLKTAIVKAYLDPLFKQPSTSNFFGNYINGVLGAAGSTIKGPSVIFDGTTITCGATGSSSQVKLVG